ncbi:MAG: SUMF1/EgtB/PvdO family nonheme iron enzyme [Sphingomicrobium sp.]
MGSEPAFEFLENGDYANGTISTPRAVACYYFETSPGQKIQAGAAGSKGLDPIVTVGAGSTCGPKLRVYGRNDDAGGGTRDAVVPFVAGGGTYVVQVSSASNTTGDFIVRVRDNAAASRKFPVGLPIRRVIQPQFADGVTASTAPPNGRPVPRAGSAFRDCADCPLLVVVKAGSFFMGSSAEEEGRVANEGPRHRVTINQPFAIGKYEVTFDEWDACVKDKGCGNAGNDNGWGRSRRPVISISWNDAMQYVRWLRRKTGQNYYLPSEAEWEYAARAGTTTPWNTGSAIITDDANILNALGRTVPVGGYPANAFGLHDTHGNVAEWVADCYEIGYFGTPNSGAAMAAKGCQGRIYRGESYFEQPFNQRLARRSGPHAPASVGIGLGFRIARSM